MQAEAGQGQGGGDEGWHCNPLCTTSLHKSAIQYLYNLHNLRKYFAQHWNDTSLLADDIAIYVTRLACTKLKLQCKTCVICTICTKIKWFIYIGCWYGNTLSCCSLHNYCNVHCNCMNIAMHTYSHLCNLKISGFLQSDKLYLYLYLYLYVHLYSYL